FASALAEAQTQATVAAAAAQTAQTQMVDAQAAADTADQKAKQLKADADAKLAKVNALQAQPQMESRDLKLHIEIGDQDKSVDMTLDYRWQHVAITLKYENNGYTVSLYKDGNLVAGPVSLASSLTPTQGTLRIGSEATDNAAYTLEMAEFELWN